MGNLKLKNYIYLLIVEFALEEGIAIMIKKYIGYHGTTNDNATKILKDKNILPSRDEDEWLGEGSYFFYDAADAHWWCREYKKLKEYTILKADVEAKTIIDFVHSREDQLNLWKLCEIVKSKSNKMSNGKIRKNYLSLAIKAMVKTSKPDIIVGGFDQNRMFWYKTNSDQAKKFPLIVMQVQICVLNKTCIKDLTKHMEVS